MHFSSEAMSLHKQQGITVLTIHGDIHNESAEEFARNLQENLEGQTPSCTAPLVIDLTSVQYLSSRALSLLASLYQSRSSRNQRVILAGLTPPVRHLFDCTKLSKVISTAQSREDALQILQSPDT